MSLIFFQGLNCYLASMINTAIITGVDYRNTFADLWSETDFTYDQIHHTYLSKRIPRNLADLGVNMEFLNCHSRLEITKRIAELPIGQWIIAGMDAFVIPWVPFYQTLHSSHYFIAKKENKSSFSCLDPTYDKKNLEITEKHMISYASDICLIHKSIEKKIKKPFPIQIQQEAQKILNTLPETQEKLLVQIRECAYGKQKNGELLAKYVDALINNRYLYLHYLKKTSLSEENYDLYFNREFFQKWTAVKHGLYKASMSKENLILIQEVCGYFKELISKEMNIARNIATI